MLSIITPNLNNSKYIEDNIISISKLSIPFEHIIVDGGSTDDSLKIISKYPHVKLLHQIEKTGMYGAIHQGFMTSTGKYITWVNADDRIIPIGFESMYKEIFNDIYNFVYSDGLYYYTKEKNEKKGKGRLLPKFYLKHGLMPFIQPSSIYTKKLYDIVGGLNYKNFKIIGDFDLFLRMAESKESKFKYISTISSVFIKRGDSLGDLNKSLHLKELTDNKMPRPNILIRILFFISKYI